MRSESEKRTQQRSSSRRSPSIRRRRSRSREWSRDHQHSRDQRGRDKQCDTICERERNQVHRQERSQERDRLRDRLRKRDYQYRERDYQRERLRAHPLREHTLDRDRYRERDRNRDRDGNKEKEVDRHRSHRYESHNYRSSKGKRCSPQGEYAQPTKEFASSQPQMSNCEARNEKNQEKPSQENKRLERQEKKFSQDRQQTSKDQPSEGKQSANDSNLQKLLQEDTQKLSSKETTPSQPGSSAVKLTPIKIQTALAQVVSSASQLASDKLVCTQIKSRNATSQPQAFGSVAVAEFRSADLLPSPKPSSVQEERKQATLEKWTDILTDFNEHEEDNSRSDQDYSRIFLLPQTHQTREHFALNNLVIAQSNALSLNLTPYYYHWCPSMFANITTLLQNPRLLKQRVRIPQEQSVNFIGMIIGPKGQCLRSMEERSGGCRIFVKGNKSALAAQNNAAGAAGFDVFNYQQFDAQPSSEVDVDSHILLIAESRKVLDKANAIVTQLLNADEPTRNKIRREQLMSVHQGGSLAATSTLNMIYEKAENSMSAALNDPALTTPYGVPSAGAHVAQIPVDCVGALIGRGGEAIKELQQRLGTKIHVARGDCRDGTEKRNVFIESSAERLPEILHVIEVQTSFRIYETWLFRDFLDKKPPVLHQRESQVLEFRRDTRKDRYEKNPNAGPYTTIFVPNEFTGVVIGKYGETVRRLQEKHGCAIFIPRCNDPSVEQRVIELSGDQSCVQAASGEIHRLVKSAQETSEYRARMREEMRERECHRHSQSREVPCLPTHFARPQNGDTGWQQAEVHGEEDCQETFVQST